MPLLRYRELQRTWQIDKKKYENFMFSFNRQLLEQQIITTRRSIENRKLIMSQNARETQRSTEEYNFENEFYRH